MEMDISVRNNGGDPALVFASNKDYRRSNVVSYLPKLADMLSTLRTIDTYSDQYVDYVNDIVVYIRNALHPQLSIIGKANEGETIGYTDYAPPRFIYVISLINPGKLTISVNKLSVFNELNGTQVVNSLLVDMYDDNTGPGPVIPANVHVIKFFLKQHPYRKVDVNIKNLKDALIDAYEARIEAVTSANDNSNSAWKKTMWFLLVLVIIVAIIGIGCGFALAIDRSGNVYEERHITNVVSG
jgi:hypothetical protein